MLKISDIRIRKIIREGRLKAVISLTIDDAIAIHDIKLVQTEERMFVSMPNRLDETGNFRDIVHPITADARNQIEEAIMKAYQDFLMSENEAGKK